jgi:D-alanyl-D-alanine carboxypeptidase/D-alanyl-D-alanine-endopeptidase (penicillin-binding protein 4)
VSDPQDPQPEQHLSRRAAREAAEAAAAARASAPRAPAPAGTSAELIPADDATALTPTVAETVLIPAAETVAAASPAPFDAKARAASALGGIVATIRKHPNAWLFSALGVAFLMLGTGAVFAGVAVGSSPPAAVVVPTNSPTPTPTPRPTPSAIADPTHLRTCSVAKQASDPNLLAFEGSVINATTGEVLFDRAGATPARTASVMKTLTAAAGLAVLGPGYQFSTKVYEGSTPGSIVLVGGGDPTLSALGPGEESVYAGAPKLSDLASQVKAAWASDTKNTGTVITSVVLDATMWNPSDNWDPTWDRSEQTQGYQPEITALMVDGDRADPKTQDSPRSNDPVGRAGSAFVSAMGLPASVSVTAGTAPAGTKLLGEVKSQPLQALISYMLPVSDNTLAEMIARVTSKVSGSDGSSGSLNTVIPAALATYGLQTSGLTIIDGSGESNSNGVPATFVAQLMTKVAAGVQNLKVVYDALPIAGRTGTLAGRFTGANAIARGAVNAKTGWIKTEYSLAGVVHAADGSTLAFAFYALGAINSRTQPALDTITTAVFSCGNNLANN